MVVRRREQGALRVVLDRKVAVVGSLGPVVGIREIGEESLDLEVGIDVVEVGILLLVRPVRRMSRTHRVHHEKRWLVHYETSLCVNLSGTSDNVKMYQEEAAIPSAFF